MTNIDDEVMITQYKDNRPPMPALTDTHQLQQKTLAMLLAIPQVMANRLWIIASTDLTNQHSTKQQHDEIHAMIAEKQLAFMQSLSDITTQLYRSQMVLGLAMLGNWQNLMMGNQQTYVQMNQKIETETLKILDKGINPYVQAVQDNQRRLVFSK